MRTLALKIVAGLSSVALAAPLLASPAFAQESTSDATGPSQACIQALAAKDDTVLSTIDARTSAEKSALQAHKAALIAAAALTDASARRDAFKKAETDFRTAMKSGMDASQTAMKAAMDAVKTACGNAGMGMHAGFGDDNRPFGDRRLGKKGLGGLMKMLHHGKKSAPTFNQ